MSIKSQLSRGTQSPVEASYSKPDRIVILSPEIADAIESSSRPGTLIEEEDAHPYVPIHLFHYAETALKQFEFERSEITSLRRGISEAQWAFKNFWNAKFGVAFIAFDRLVIRSKYSVILDDKLQDEPWKNMRYSSLVEGWIIVEPDMEEGDYEEILKEYDIKLSPGFLAHSEGREAWRDYLKDHVAHGRENGYRIPSIFPTERTLKPHQQDAVCAINSMKSAILADQVGLGKGGSFISSYLSNVQRGMIQKIQEPDQLDYEPEFYLDRIQQMKETGEDRELWPVVISTNKSLKYDIAGEILKWDSTAIVEVLEGTKPAEIPEDTQFIVLNVDLLSSRMPDILEAQPKGYIADEFHTLKNPGAKRTQAAQELSSYLINEHGNDAFIVGASGTPFLNSTSELWSVLEVLGISDIFSDYAYQKIGKEKVQIRTKRGKRWVPISPKRAFEIRWCDGHSDKYGNWFAEGSSHTAELNRLLLKHCMVRRRKSDVIHPLPKLEEKELIIDPDPEWYQDYREAEDEFSDWLKEQARLQAEEDGVNIAQAMRSVVAKLSKSEHIMKMTSLRQLAAKCKLSGIRDWVHRFMEGDPEITGGDETRNKLIIFAYHRDIQDDLINDPELQEYGMVHIVAGQKDVEEHKELFQKSPDHRLMICYSGAREGHTLTAAKDVLLAELPFVPSWIVQMVGRAWARISEDFEPHEAYLHYAIMPHGIDGVLLRKNRIKQETFNAVIDGEGVEENFDEGDEENMSNAEKSQLYLDLITSGKHQIRIAGER